MMMDFSPSALHRIAQERLDWTNLDAIWISHFHLDHFGGLAPFLFGTRYAPEMQERNKPLTVYGPSGLRKLLETYDNAYDFGFLVQPFPLEIVEVEPGQKFQVLKDVEATSFDTPHTDESRAIGLRDENGKSLVFSADTGFSKALGSFARDVDLFVLECSFVKNKPVEMHIQLEEAVYLARYSRAKRVLLTHLYPEWDDVDFNREVESYSPSCEIIEATDGLILEL